MKSIDAEAVVRGLAAGGAVRRTEPEMVEAAYQALPALECQGKCASACGPVPISPLEQQRIEARGVRWVPGRVVRLPDGSRGGTVCCALDQKSLRCRVYEDRPMVCRLWGLVESLACPWGCEPVGGLLSDLEGLRLMNRVLWFGGSSMALEPAEWDRRVAAHPEVRAEMVGRLERPVKEEPVFLQGTIRVRRRSAAG